MTISMSTAWKELPPDHLVRVAGVLDYIERGASAGLGPVEWETIKACLRRCSREPLHQSLVAIAEMLPDKRWYTFSVKLRRTAGGLDAERHALTPVE